ncbi:MAG: ABC-2 transporter permease [Lachnospiraceae bacterium]
MKGLLKKDLLVLMKQLLIYMILIPFFSLSGNAFSVLAIILGAVLPMTAVAYDDQSKWNELAVMLPYSKMDLVFSKYLVGYVCMAGAGVLVLVGRMFLYMLGKGNMDDVWTVLWGGLVCGLLFLAINNPILFKFGAEKGRYVYLLVIFLIGASGPFLKGLHIKVSPDMRLPKVIILGLVVVLNMISVLISIRIKEKE